MALPDVGGVAEWEGLVGAEWEEPVGGVAE